MKEVKVDESAEVETVGCGEPAAQRKAKPNSDTKLTPLSPTPIMKLGNALKGISAGVTSSSLQRRRPLPCSTPPTTSGHSIPVTTIGCGADSSNHGTIHVVETQTVSLKSKKLPNRHGRLAKQIWEDSSLQCLGWWKSPKGVLICYDKWCKNLAKKKEQRSHTWRTYGQPCGKNSLQS